MTWQGACVIYEDTCAACGEGVKACSDNGTLEVPVGGQTIVCLQCIVFGHKQAEEAFSAAEIPFLVKSELREAR